MADSIKHHEKEPEVIVKCELGKGPGGIPTFNGKTRS